MFRILVIRLGALGDFVLSFGPFASIRAAYPGAEITLLTTEPFRALAEAAPWFDRVLCDERPRMSQPVALWRLLNGLKSYDLVFDLQTSRRSARYFALAGRPCWSGAAPGCAHPHDNPWRNHMHTIVRQRDQLRRARVASIAPDLSWLAAQGPVLHEGYAVLVPGASPHRPTKRWSTTHFGRLASHLRETGLRTVVVGAQADRHLAREIMRECPETLDLTGQTSLPELAGLLSRATLACGNDTGPMHLAAAMGCRALVLFSGDSDPRLTAPVGRVAGAVRVLAEENLADLPVARVAALADELAVFSGNQDFSGNQNGGTLETAVA
ncbi:glycosyltransferase family 9 protein [Brytella acorum]|uniref:Glycosyltransferase family 9 protein n=1 Tax=Brytella acorum TaxID=2959299 RepID=A0AA35Y3I4_9PROT|nr:glycosyltransferase family 9 protein [Brytella acorum]MDF3624913.1 glycosyltransferase family 9 protein [Brytella acorum]CAI9120219.1 glycosyltransferase family 9 protein [Brytella acorum]